MEIFQALTPILGLTVTTVISTPLSADVSIELYDNGLGMHYAVLVMLKSDHGPSNAIKYPKLFLLNLVVQT